MRLHGKSAARQSSVFMLHELEFLGYRSLRIRTVVEFYNHTLQPQYRCMHSTRGNTCWIIDGWVPPALLQSELVMEYESRKHDVLE